MIEDATFLVLKWLQKQSLSMYFVSTLACCMLGCCQYKYIKYIKLCSSYLFKKDINLNVHFHQTFIVQPSHVVTLTHSTIQYGVTALQQASNEGRQKVVELLLVAGANPDLQNKVRTGWHSA